MTLRLLICVKVFGAATICIIQSPGHGCTPRHALGALLLEQGHYEEAEEVYRADLGLDDTVPRCRQHKNNVWALHGIVECLKERNGEMECNKLQGLLAEALSKTDLTITSSCCCRKTVSQSST